MTAATAPPNETPSMWRQPRAVWAVAFACVIAFMGIGLVDPILPAISRELNATPAQSMLLFAGVIGLTIWQFRSTGRRVTYG